MTSKILILYLCSRETRTGLVRREETRGKSILSLAGGYRGVLGIMGRSRGTVFSLLVTALVGAVGMINITFWQVIASKKLGVPDALLPFFPMFRSLIALVFFFTVIPRLTKISLKLSLIAGFSSYFVGQSILVAAPAEGDLRYGLLLLSLLFDGFGAGILAMLAESLVALHVNAAERARVMALQHMIIMFATSPFGWIGGILSGISRSLPFVLNQVLLLTGLGVTLFYYRNRDRLPGEAPEAR